MSAALLEALASTDTRHGTAGTGTSQFRVHLSRLLQLKRGRLLLLMAGIATLLLIFHSTRSQQPSHSLQLATHSTNELYLSGQHIDWSKFAYVQYATNTIYLCNSVMLFEILHRLGSRAERLLMYPSSFEIESAVAASESPESNLLTKARDLYGAVLEPIEVQKRASKDRTVYFSVRVGFELTWACSYMG